MSFTSDWVLRMIHDLRAQGLSRNGIADRLNAAGITTPRGRKWSAARVSQLLGNGNSLTRPGPQPMDLPRPARGRSTKEDG